MFDNSTLNLNGFYTTSSKIENLECIYSFGTY